MYATRATRPRVLRLQWLAVVLAWLAAAAGAAEPPTPQGLRTAHEQMRLQLARSPFGRPVLLDSSETPDGLQGDVYAVVDHPMTEVGAALKTPGHWCDLLVLHIDNRRCRLLKEPQGETLTLFVVRRFDDAIGNAFELSFAWRLLHSTPEHLSIELEATNGPMGTSNYRVRLDAVALDARQTFLHFAYSYEHNLMAKLATQAYLATFGADKVGFTVVGKTPAGTPEHIRGLRGLVERNAMRYFLTLDAYLAGLDAPPSQQADRRLRHWYAAAEKHPRQLHEVDLETYLALKRADRERDRGAH